MSVADLHFITGIGERLGGSSLLAAQFHRLGLRATGPCRVRSSVVEKGTRGLGPDMCQPVVRQDLALGCERVSSLPSILGGADQSAVSELPVDAAGSWVAVRSR